MEFPAGIWIAGDLADGRNEEKDTTEEPAIAEGVINSRGTGKCKIEGNRLAGYFSWTGKLFLQYRRDALNPSKVDPKEGEPKDGEDIRKKGGRLGNR